MKSFFLLFLGFSLMCSSVVAQDGSPDALVKKLSDDVLNIVRQDKDIQRGNTKKAIDLGEAQGLRTRPA